VPYIVEGEKRKFSPGTNYVVSIAVQGIGPWSSMWYKIRLNQTERWVVPGPYPDEIMNYNVIKEPVQLKTAARYLINLTLIYMKIIGCRRGPTKQRSQQGIGFIYKQLMV
jgi:hypothetical protein